MENNPDKTEETEQNMNGNSYTWCPKTSKRIPVPVCETCTDKTTCQDKKDFEGDMKAFEEILGKPAFYRVLMAHTDYKEVKDIPPKAYQMIRDKVSEAVDQRNSK